MKILALDLGTKTGWSYWSEKTFDGGTMDFSETRFSGGGMRFLKFRRWLSDLKSKGIDVVYYEAVRAHKGVDAAHVYGGFQGVLTEWCERNEIPYDGVPVGTIKKFISGAGNAGKQEVIKAVKTVGFDPVDDNHADAIALMLYAKKQLGGTNGRVD